MPHIANRSRGAAAITPFVLLLACLGLGACGSSSSSTTNTTAAVASTPATTTESTPPPSTTPAATATTESPPTPADKRRRQVALRVVKCFQSDGVILPEPNSQGYITVGSAAGSGQFKVALAKCKPILSEAAGLSGKK